MSRLYLASDLHMGDGGPRDDFTPAMTERFCQEVNAIPADAGIILLGDVLDGHRYSLRACLKAHRRELVLLDTKRFVWVIGNHDESVVRAVAASNIVRHLRYSDTVHIGDVGWYFCHGHQFDPLCSGRFAWVGRAASQLANLIGKVSPRWEDRLAAWAGKLERTGRYSREQDFTEAAFAYAEAHNYGGIVCGHTHCRKEQMRGNRVYINTGTYAQDGWRILVDGR